MYFVTTFDEANERSSDLNVNANPPIDNSKKRMTVTTIPNVSKMQCDSTIAPQQPRKATRKIKQPSTIMLYTLDDTGEETNVNRLVATMHSR